MKPMKKTPAEKKQGKLPGKRQLLVDLRFLSEHPEQYGEWAASVALDAGKLLRHYSEKID